MDLSLYAITDSKWKSREPLAQQVEKAIRGGATILQYREKTASYEEKKAEAAELLAICRSYGVPLLINDDVALALEIDADGVHLGQDDMKLEEARALLGPDKIIGITAKTIPLALAAQASGADYLGSGAVFGTSTKLDAKPMDHEVFQSIAESVDIPVVAIGGITAENLPQLAGRKMAGFAIVSGIFGQDDVFSATQHLKQLAREALR